MMKVGAEAANDDGGTAEGFVIEVRIPNTIYVDFLNNP